jgi:hypothetical protein
MVPMNGDGAMAQQKDMQPIGSMILKILDDLGDLEEFQHGKAAVAILEKMPLIGGFYVIEKALEPSLPEDIRMTPEEHDDALRAFNRAGVEMVGAALEEGVRRGELIRHLNGGYTIVSPGLRSIH